MAIIPNRLYIQNGTGKVELTARIKVLEDEIEQLKRDMAELLLIYGVKKEEDKDERSNAT